MKVEVKKKLFLFCLRRHQTSAKKLRVQQFGLLSQTTVAMSVVCEEAIIWIVNLKP